MNSIKSFLIIAAITSLLVMSASLVSDQSYGNSGDHQNKKASSNSEKADQNANQEGDCQIPEDCQQANQAQHARGKGNYLTGFNDQSDNPPQSDSPSTLFSLPSPITTTPTTPTTNQPDSRQITVTIPDEGVCSEGSFKASVNDPLLPAFLCVGVEGTTITSTDVQLGVSGQSCPTGFSPSTILIGRETLDLCVKVFV
jgi:hypothetical protein